MPLFTLTTHDPSEPYDDVPATLTPLAAWLAAHRAGRAAWLPDPYVGIGVRISDGSSQYFEPVFGDARSIADNLAVAADRLAAGRITLLRTAIDAPGVYVFLQPRGAQTRAALVLERPPRGDGYPYHPNRHGAATQADTDALYAWAEAEVERLMAPTGNARLDAAQGRLLRLSTPELIANLRAEAQVAKDVAALLGLVPYQQ